MRMARRAVLWAVAALALLLLAFAAYALLRNRPEDLPWTALDLNRPVGLFTARKIAGLGDDPARCRALLERAGVRFDAMAPVEGAQPLCGYADGVRFAGGGTRSIDYLPGAVTVACPVAAALALWEWHVVQPAAQRHFGVRVSAIEHFGSYSCRRIAGGGGEGWSQHATADAIDIRAFRLADARRIAVKQEWKGGDGAREAFLREVRDGACGVFGTVLSPDYNAAHADHFHFDTAAAGRFGWRACR
ncbi:extensin family protein [Sphingomonas canadensis]|uniref:Extensin family protein n=1 Tax=Sphingomonas canadensis TaxID=1219257 RepID=A0ABW3H631_9SPHN|nr:extensin family protein [Sphingomonas canadensis]MCW3836460.1 extensin family protein [Sphingomonas canadensis]